MISASHISAVEHLGDVGAQAALALAAHADMAFHGPKLGVGRTTGVGKNRSVLSDSFEIAYLGTLRALRIIIRSMFTRSTGSTQLIFIQASHM